MVSEFDFERYVVLIVEDDQIFRSLAFEVLDGHERILAINAREGGDKFRKYAPDITFLDIGLPDKSGLDLLKEMKAQDPEAFIVMLTSSSVSSDVKSAKDFGAAGYIIKPFSRKKVREYFEKYRDYKDKLSQMTPEEKAQYYMESFTTVEPEKHEPVLEIKKAPPKPQPKAPEPVQESPAPVPVEDEKSEITKEDVLPDWHILFVDDYFANSTRAQEELGKLGCTVDIADNGQEAVQKTEAKKYDLIFMDDDMPEMDGYDATRAIRKKDRKVAIVGMIENSYEIETQKWLRVGMNEYVSKPTKFKTLRDIVDKYIKKHIADSNEEYIE